MHCGWQVIQRGRIVYQQEGKGGGRKTINFPKDHGYTSTLDEIRRAFNIPDGEDPYLTNYNGDPIKKKGFTIGGYVSKVKADNSKNTPRLYIVTGQRYGNINIFGTSG